MKKYIFIFCLLPLYQLFSQELINTEGKDFWLTFLPNYHNNNTINETDSLYIFVSAQKPTKGEIIYRNINGIVSSRKFEITDPSVVYTFAVSFFNFELKGFNNSGRIDTNNQCERPANQYFRVITDEDVTVYALNQANLTSEAFLVLPSNVLGNEYYVLTYNSDGKLSLLNQVTGASTPSQFVLLALEDNTLVEIKPSDATYRYGTNTHSVWLNAGESYLVQARITSSNLNRDLTGSYVKSTKPVAVFAGHQRATVPIDLSDNNPSRDFLCEQMIPTRAWGKNAIVVPFETPREIIQSGRDLIRIMASNDNTTIRMNNSEVTIHAGSFIELPLENPAFIEADKPILVAQYKKTANLESSRNNISDPLMLIVPPVEQYITSYRVINAQAPGYDETKGVYYKAYDEQYITVIADNIAYSSGIFINNIPINQSLFKQVPNKQYYWANVRVSDGVNSLSSVGKFAVYVYGYGNANSYGYLGGMGMAILDVMPPEIYAETECYKIKGSVTDSNLTDSKIKTVNSSNQENVRLTIEPFSELVPFVNFNAELVNIYQDGSFTIFAEDALGQRTEKTFEIAGFTVSVLDYYSDETPVKVLNFASKTNVCFDLTLYNYGRFDVEIDKAYFKNNSFFLNTTLINRVSSKDSVKLEFCNFYDKDTTIIDTLIIENACGKYDVMQLLATFFSDTLPPQLLLVEENCNIFFEYNLLEDRIFDTGIREIVIEKQINCNISYDLSDKKNAKLSINVINTREDAEFRIAIIDNNGQQSVLERIIPGFTISSKYIDNSATFLFDTTVIGDLVCKSIELFNYGNYELVLNDVFMFNNIYFSIPPSQKPLKIKPKATSKVDICFNPVEANKNYQDTLVMDFNCIITKIPVEGISKKIDFSLSSKCNVDVVFLISKSTNRVQISPNPIISSGIIQIPFIENNKKVKVEIYDSFANKLVDLFEGENVNSAIQLNFDAKDFCNGLYFAIVYYDNSSERIPFIILK